MKKFFVFGDIVDTEAEKTTSEDICPKDFKDFLSEVEDNEDIELHINSCGGSVSAGLSIANLLTHHSGNTTAVVDGLAASIASVIACACDVIQMGRSSYLMIHKVFGTVCGNADDLRKEADTMEKLTKSLLSFYHRKFDLTDEQLEKYLAAETWISGAEIADFKLNAVVDEDIQQVKYAAKLIDKMKKIFTNKEIMRTFDIMEKPEEIKTEAVEETKTVETPVVEEKPAEEIKEEVKEAVEEIKEEKEEQKIEELVKRLQEENACLKQQLDECQKKMAECTECKPEEDVEKRVSGMQSKMQNKINDLTKDFKNKLEQSEKELSEYKAQITSLKETIEKSEQTRSELQANVSALKDELMNKTEALDTLNAKVLEPAKPVVDYKNLHGKEFIEWLKTNKKI